MPLPRGAPPTFIAVETLLKASEDDIDAQQDIRDHGGILLARHTGAWGRTQDEVRELQAALVGSQRSCLHEEYEALKEAVKQQRPRSQPLVVAEMEATIQLLPSAKY